jgi:sulfur relay protein TusB/DsrH
MQRILHILKESQSSIALEMIREEGKNSQQEVNILLIQEAVRDDLSLGNALKVYILKEDLEERGLSSPEGGIHTLINYKQMLELLYRVDKVVTW